MPNWVYNIENRFANGSTRQAGMRFLSGTRGGTISLIQLLATVPINCYSAMAQAEQATPDIVIKEGRGADESGEEF